MLKKMFIEIRLCSPMTYIYRGDVKIVKIYMVKFDVSILDRLKIMGFFVNTKYIHKNNVIFNKTVTELVTILTKCFFPYLNPASYFKLEFLRNSSTIFRSSHAVLKNFAIFTGKQLWWSLLL